MTDEERAYILNDIETTQKAVKIYHRIERRRYWRRVAVWLFFVCLYAAALIVCIQTIITKGA